MPTIPKAPKRPWMAKTKPHSGRKNPNSDFYNSTRWRKVRLGYIRQHPLCVMCKELGEIKEGKVVDHIKRINDGGAKYAWSNFQTLCDHHHNQKSGKESAESKKK